MVQFSSRFNHENVAEDLGRRVDLEVHRIGPEIDLEADQEVLKEKEIERNDDDVQEAVRKVDHKVQFRTKTNKIRSFLHCKIVTFQTVKNIECSELNMLNKKRKI